MSEPWLDKRKLADWYSCSVRSIETAQAQGMPFAVIFGRVKFQVSAVEPWLEERGHLRRTSSSSTVAQLPSGRGTADTAPGPTTGG